MRTLFWSFLVRRCYGLAVLGEAYPPMPPNASQSCVEWFALDHLVCDQSFATR